MVQQQDQSLFDDGLLAQGPDGRYRVVEDPKERVDLQTTSKQKQQHSQCQSVVNDALSFASLNQLEGEQNEQFQEAMDQ